MEGVLRAEGRSETYAVTRGIPRLLPTPTMGTRTRASFAFQWARRVSGLEPEQVCYGFPLASAMDLFGRTVVPSTPAQNRWILDAGCGSAEKSASLARQGHPVIAFDLSNSVDAAFERFQDIPSLHLLQADVLHPPISPAAMDAVICVGVLHHTPDAHGGFRALTRLQGRGGRLLVWLYPRDRRSTDPFLGTLYRLRDGLRVAHRLGPRGTYALSILVAAGLYPFFAKRFRRLRPGERVSGREIWGAILFNTYDFLAPRYQSRHSPKEVTEWFEDDGYSTPERLGTGFYFAEKRKAPPSSR